MRGESGWTMVELIVAMGLMLVISSAAVVALQTGNDSVGSTASKQEALAEAQTGLQQMVRDARQSTQIGVPTGGRAMYLITYDKTAGSAAALASTHVRYDCTAGSNSRCDRTICSGALPANVLTASCTAAETRTVARSIATSGQIFTPELNAVTQAVPDGTNVSSTGIITNLSATTGLDFMNIDLKLLTNNPNSASVGRTGRGPNVNPVRLQSGVDLENFDN